MCGCIVEFLILALAIGLGVAIAPHIFGIIGFIFIIIVGYIVISFLIAVFSELSDSKSKSSTDKNKIIDIEVESKEEIIVDDEVNIEDIDPQTYKSIFKEEKPIIKKSDSEENNK